MNILSFKPKQTTKKIISHLPERARSVIISRYGLGADNKKMTLEAIGQTYGITRERVRQIENYALDKIKRSDAINREQPVFNELASTIDSLGIVLDEKTLLNYLFPKQQDEQNHLYFLLVIGDPFFREKEDDNLKHRWHIDSAFADKIYNALGKLKERISESDIIPEKDIFNIFIEYAGDVPRKYLNDRDVLTRWLSISKQIDKNQLGDWGLASSPNINAKGMIDYAYLVIRQHGSPMHFAEVTKKISECFNRKAHVATCHNALIKDPRFVLVGRGLYALTEWGYMTGVVKDVIKQILEQGGSLSRDEIIEKVLKERYVKANTILVNLQDPKLFKKTKDGKYIVV